MMRALLSLALAVAGSLLVRPARAEQEASEQEAARKTLPNIVLVIADDLKPSVLGFEGDPVVRTPHLDRMAAEGTSFSRAYVPLPQCGPSRAALLVGRYPHESGSLTNPGRWDPDHRTMAQLLAARGYRTGLVGKWHLQDDDRPQAGFESWCTIARTFQTYFDPVLWVDGERRDEAGFLTNVLTDRAIEFIDGPEDDERPFFLWLAYKSPHEPWTMPEGEEFAYRRKDLPIPATITDDLSTKPKAQREGRPHEEFVGTKRRTLRLALERYYGMISSLDANVGRLLGHLEERGIERETLVVFLSDNGFMTGDHQMFTKGPAFYEELVRTPLVFHWPGTIPAGERSPALVSTLDLLPTLVTLAGGDVPAEVDGVDLGRLIHGKVDTVRDALFLEYVRKLDEVVPMLGIVTADAKYVRYLATEEEELYDLAADPLEMRNLAGSPEHAERLAGLRARTLAFGAGIEEPFW